MTRPVTLTEPHFSQHTLNKYASLMAQGNGYLGLRASHEEDYTRQTRGMYLAGLYHRAGKNDINELVNLPDVIGMEITLNGELFALSRETWQRELDFASGELRRNVVWSSASGARYAIASRRFVSAEQLPLMALEISITPLDADAPVLISTGIDATQTNHGRQHLDETQVRVFGQHLMQGIYTTQDGRSDVAISCCCQVSGDVQQCYTAKERRLLQHTSAQLPAGKTLSLQKRVWIDWRDDRHVALDEWGSAAELRPTSCSIHRKLASVVAETSYHGKRRRCARSASVRLCALSPTHHDACSRRAQQYCGKRFDRGRLQRPRFLGYGSIFTAVPSV